MIVSIDREESQSNTYNAVKLVENAQHAQVAAVWQLDGLVLSTPSVYPGVRHADVVVYLS